MTSANQSKQRQKTISFKVDEAFYNHALVESAKKGLTPHKQAKELFLEAIGLAPENKPAS